MSLFALVVAHAVFVKVRQKISEYLDKRNKEKLIGVDEQEEKHHQTPARPPEEEEQDPASPVEDAPELEEEDSGRYVPPCPAEESLEDHPQEDHPQETLASPVEDAPELEEENSDRYVPACPAEESLEDHPQETPASPVEDAPELEEENSDRYVPACPAEESLEDHPQETPASPVEETPELEEEDSGRYVPPCPAEESLEDHPQEDHPQEDHPQETLGSPAEETPELVEEDSGRYVPPCPAEESLEKDDSNPQQTSDILSDEHSDFNSDEERIEEINQCQYEIGNELGSGSFGAVYEARRISDGLDVAVKCVYKKEMMDSERLVIPDHPKPLPLEIALHVMANKGPKVPEILQILDWEEQEEYYLLVLERMSPCMDLCDYTEGKEILSENVIRVIMRQATTAAYVSYQRGVFHRDIKLDNLLINPKTMEVKLIDFGCGNVVKESGYTKMAGTEEYFCPEAHTRSEYYAGPATVYSLGVTLFIMVCGTFPSTDDCYKLENNIFHKEGLSEECCKFIRACMRTEPEQRIPLDVMLDHDWFQFEDTNDESSDKYDINHNSGNSTSGKEEEVKIEDKSIIPA